MARLSWLCCCTQGAQPGSTDPSQASFTQLPAPAGVWKDLHLPSDAVSIVNRWPDHSLLRSALRGDGPSVFLSSSGARTRTGATCRKDPGDQPTSLPSHALAFRCWPVLLCRVTRRSFLYHSRARTLMFSFGQLSLPTSLSPSLPSPRLGGGSAPPAGPPWCQMNSRACFHG